LSIRAIIWQRQGGVWQFTELSGERDGDGLPVAAYLLPDDGGDLANRGGWYLTLKYFVLRAIYPLKAKS